MFEDLLCPTCGSTAADPIHPGDPCICGGLFEHIDPEILKALMPFAPTKPDFKLRVWQIRNGIPIAMGVLDKSVSEEEFIRFFNQNMPMPGEPPGRYTLRAIDQNHNEVGTEITLRIPSDHPALVKFRAVQRQQLLSAGIPAPTRIVENVHYSSTRYR